MKYLCALLLAAAVLLSGCAANVRKTPGENARLAIPADSSRQIVMNVTGSEIPHCLRPPHSGIHGFANDS
jgi:hypothetical protein